MSGEAAIMARYLGHVATFRATVPLGIKVTQYSFPHQTIVDAATHSKVAATRSGAVRSVHG